MGVSWPVSSPYDPEKLTPWPCRRTDLDGSLIPLDLPPVDGESPAHSSNYRIHSAILSAARYLLSPSSSSPLYSNLSRILAEHPGYALVFTGHSLGAALASTLALLVGMYDPVERRWVVGPLSSLGHGEEEEAGPRRPVRAVCFAHPTTLNVPLAERCAIPKQALRSREELLAADESNCGTPLVVNVSLGADVICRMGVPQVREIRRTLGRLDRMRTSTYTNDKAGPPGIFSSWRRWRKVVGSLRTITEGDASSSAAGATAAKVSHEEEEEALAALERSRAELEARAWHWRSEAEGWDRQRSGTLPEEADVEVAIPAGHCFHLDSLPPRVLEAHRRQKLEEARDKAGDTSYEEDEEEDELLGFYEVRDPTRFYAMPILSADLLGAHMPKAYLEATQSL